MNKYHSSLVRELEHNNFLMNWLELQKVKAEEFIDALEVLIDDGIILENASFIKEDTEDEYKSVYDNNLLIIAAKI